MIKGNAILDSGPTHPNQRSGPIIDDPHPDRTDAVNDLLIATPAEFLWGRQKSGLDRPIPSTGQRSPSQVPEMWRDGLLAEIENLTDRLKHKILRYVMLRASQVPDQTLAPDNEAAVAWVQEALADIAATARGIEIASHEMFLRAMTTHREDLQSESAQGLNAGIDE